VRVFLGSCPICVQEQIDPRSWLHIFTQTNDLGVYVHTCSFNHTVVYSVNCWKFDILFGGALIAICDGYYREAIVDFAACTERFSEFYCEAMAVKNNISPSNFEAAWKPLKKLSERQTGAFYMLYLHENKKPVPNLDNQKISKKSGDYKSFRNQVIHNGYIPTREEVIKFGECTFQHVADLLCSLSIIRVNKSNYVETSLLEYMHLQLWSRNVEISNNRIAELRLPSGNSVGQVGGTSGLITVAAVDGRVKSNFESCLEIAEKAYLYHRT